MVKGIGLTVPIGLGHRRLSIIDLSDLASQPMLSEDGRFALSYNGELYNFRDLRAELELKGFVFRSESDTEVVLKALICWGPDAFEKFNGMFALALWDKKSQKLLLARDRYGVKPLYYSAQGKIFTFASEQKAMCALPWFKNDLDKEALLEYFTFQNIFSDKTLIKNVRLLPAGHYLQIGVGDTSNSINHVQYWDFDFVEPESPGDPREYEEELDRLFSQAVNRQLVSDVEIGAYLSGGMDSGSITALAAKQFPYIKSFTCGFDLNSASGIELGFDEREKAEYMSYFFKTEHYEMVLKSGDMERILPKLAWHLEEPRVGQSYPNYYAAKLASKFVKVVLSGAGGDELFGGYPWRYYRAVNNDDFENYVDKYYVYWQRLIDNHQLKQIFSPIAKDVEGVWTRDIFRDVFKKHAEKLNRPEDYINHSLYFEAKTFLHGLLVVEDKLSMAHGLETRVPFLDNDVVDFAMKVPVSLKLRNLAAVTNIDQNDVPNKPIFQKSNDGKEILRKVMTSHIPEKITAATKQGFSAPDASWFKGESMAYVRRVLFEQDSPFEGIFDTDAVKNLVLEHLNGEKNRRLFIWSLLNLRDYLKHYGV